MHITLLMNQKYPPWTGRIVIILNFHVISAIDTNRTTNQDSIDRLEIRENLLAVRLQLGR